jgi:flagellar biosynthesis anti-sigma factor FlgM
MAIQPLNKPTHPVLPTKSTAIEKTKGSETQANKKLDDHVDFTAVAKEITKAFESSDTSHIINKTRVNEVKQALTDGTYPINTERIAEKMIQMESISDPLKNSR